MGFTADEAQDALVPRPQTGPNLFARTIDVTRKPDLAGLAEEEALAVRVRQDTQGEWSVELRDELSPQLETRILAEVPETKRPEARIKIEVHNREVRERKAVHVVRPPFPVPRMWVTVDGQPLLFSDEVVDDEVVVDLSEQSVDLHDFQYTPETQSFAIDFLQGKLEVNPIGREQAALPLEDERQSERGLVKFLNYELRDWREDSRQKQDWLERIVHRLIAEVGVPLAKLYQGKFALVRRLKQRLDEARVLALSRGYQRFLLNVEVRSDDPYAFRYEPGRYYPHRLHHGFSFSKHFYDIVGEMNLPEIDCAICMDSDSRVRCWVRNVESDERNSFWLPKQKGKFYPDFVAELTNGRVLVVEYKGEMEVKADSDEKQRLGEIWESGSNGRGLFIMVRERDADGRNATAQILHKIGQGAQ